MLVLSRLKGESLVIGANVEIYVADIQGDRVRLAVRAPRDITVHRKEVAERMQAEGVELAELAPVGPTGPLPIA